MRFTPVWHVRCCSTVQQVAAQHYTATVCVARRVLPCVVLQCCVLRQVADVLCQMQLHDAQQLVQRLGELMLLQSRALPASAACYNTAHRAQAGPAGLSYTRQGFLTSGRACRAL